MVEGKPEWSGKELRSGVVALSQERSDGAREVERDRCEGKIEKAWCCLWGLREQVESG